MAYWQPIQDTCIVPPDAVHVGKDLDGDDVFVGRAFIEMELTPGRLIPNKRACFIPYKGHEVKMTECEVLVAIVGFAASSVAWVPESNGKVPLRAIEAGYDENGVKLYVGRKSCNETMVCGKIHPKYGVLYFPFEGHEHTSKTYDALVAV